MRCTSSSSVIVLVNCHFIGITCLQFDSHVKNNRICPENFPVVHDVMSSKLGNKSGGRLT